MFFNRISEYYGEDCMVNYGNWSSKKHSKGHQPTQTSGIRALISKRFKTSVVDEFRTSKYCHGCTGVLKQYHKLNGRLSYRRLFCGTCAVRGKRKKFLDKDENAAMNILIGGTSTTRPPYMRRQMEVSYNSISIRVFFQIQSTAPSLIGERSRAAGSGEVLEPGSGADDMDQDSTSAVHLPRAVLIQQAPSRADEGANLPKSNEALPEF